MQQPTRGTAPASGAAAHEWVWERRQWNGRTAEVVKLHEALQRMHQSFDRVLRAEDDPSSSALLLVQVAVRDRVRERAHVEPLDRKVGERQHVLQSLLP